MLSLILFTQQTILGCPHSGHVIYTQKGFFDSNTALAIQSYYVPWKIELIAQQSKVFSKLKKIE